MPIARRRASMFAVLLSVALLAALIVWVLPGLKRIAAPAVEFGLLDGNRASVTDLRGRPVLLVFWATSCPPCIDEIPDLVKLHESLSSRGLMLIAVAMPYDPPVVVRDFARERQLPYAVAIDVPGHAARAFGIPAIPSAVLIDRDGRIAWQQTGRLDTPRVRRLIESMLDPG
ncbi:MAG: TlpA disulfide reductase family protein [Pseudomonadota bacterium]